MAKIQLCPRSTVVGSDYAPQHYLMRKIMRASLLLRSSVTMFALLSAAPAFAEDLEFTLNNVTSTDLVEFYLSPVGVNNWEENLLNGTFLPAGNTIQVTVGDGRTVCTYDVLSVFKDGDKVEERGVDLCSLGSYTLHQ